jgi:hypothetical protein
MYGLLLPGFIKNHSNLNKNEKFYKRVKQNSINNIAVCIIIVLL